MGRLGPSKRGSSAVIGIVLLVSAACAPNGSKPAVSATSPTTGPARAIIAVGPRPGVPLAAAGAVWVPNTGDGTVSRIDPRSDRVVATLRIGNQAAFYQRDCEAKGSVHSFMGTSFHVRDCDLPSALAAGAGALWILKNDDQVVLRVDPESQRVLARIPLGFTPFDIAATDNAVWITGYWVDQLVRIDPKSNQVAARLTLPDGASGLAVSDEAVWVVSTVAGKVSRIDPATNQVIATVTLDCPAACYQGSLPLPVVAARDAIWVRTVGNGLVVRIDPKTNRVTANIDVLFPLGRAGEDHLAILNGAVWVSGTSLQRIDPQTNRVSGTVDVSATSVAAGFGSLWVTDIFGRIERISPAS